MTARVSILMTIYNPGRFLAPAVESLLRQTMPDFELIAVENGSRDGSRDVIRRYTTDPRIRLIEKDDNIGRVAALNLALRDARADYVAILDADDVTHPERLADEARVLDAEPDVVTVGSHARLIDAEDRVIGAHTPQTTPEALLDALAYSNPFPHSSVMYRRRAAIECGGYDPRYPFANDLAMTLNLTRRGQPAMIGRFLTDVRYHAGNASSAPAHYYSRYDEMLALYRSSMQRPGLSPRARRLGHANLATTHYVYARELAKGGRPFPALVHLGCMIAADPVFCLRRAAVHAMRPFASNVDSADVSAR